MEKGLSVSLIDVNCWTQHAITEFVVQLQWSFVGDQIRPTRSARQPLQNGCIIVADAASKSIASLLAFAFPKS